MTQLTTPMRDRVPVARTGTRTVSPAPAPASDVTVIRIPDPILSNSSYIVASVSAGIAAVIDPRRDIGDYTEIIRRNGWTLRYALETHLHSDFVSGARELAAWARAQQPGTRFDMGASVYAQSGSGIELLDGRRLPLGNSWLRVISTPGHAVEHLSFLAGESRASHVLFSGGALLPGGAGRTDLLGPALTPTLTGMLYTTIHKRLLTLPGDTTVFPTHLGGSFCAAGTGADEQTTIAHERASNPLALARDAGEFATRACSHPGPAPAYFSSLRMVNRRGAPLLRTLPLVEALSPAATWYYAQAGGVVIDVRSAEAFALGHLPGSLNIPLGSPLATWAGWSVPPASPVVLVADRREDLVESVRQLRLVGFDTVIGYLAGGVEAWGEAELPVTRSKVLDSVQLRRAFQRGAVDVVDVRFEHEWRAGHVPGAVHLPLPDLIGGELPPRSDRHTVIQCGRGNRAALAQSLLEQRGWTNVAVQIGGFGAWQEAGFEVSCDD